LNISQPCLDASDKGTFVDMRTKAYDAYLHIKHGNIVPMQDAV